MTYPLASLSVSLTSAGITAPTFTDILESLKAEARGILGSDIYLEADSQDGQLLAVFARHLYEVNAACVAVYAAFSPASAIGAGLSAVVAINGLQRLPASNSQVNVTLVGTAGTIITNGKVRDTQQRLWSLPSTVTIPSGGTLLVTATCDTAGRVAASAGEVNAIATPTRGWTSVSNATAASQGEDAETDASLRQRQAESVSLPAVSLLDGMRAALLSIAGVTEARVYENNTGVTDALGLPAHSIAPVVAGGDSDAIASAIFRYKTPGASLVGTTLKTVYDSAGYAVQIRYEVPADVRIRVAVGIHAGSGYSSVVADTIKARLAAQIESLDMGEDVILTRLWPAALIVGDAYSSTYTVTSLQIAQGVGAFGSSDVVIAYNARASCVVADVSITLL